MIFWILQIIFASLSISFYIAYIVLRGFKQRKLSAVFELVSVIFFVAFTTQFLMEHDLFAPATYNLENVAMFLLFLFSIVVLIYKVIALFRHHY